MKKILTFSLPVFLLLILPNFALAHKINVFAYEEGGKIYCESTFSGGRPAKNGLIKVISINDGAELITARTDDNGKFSFETEKLAEVTGSVNVVVQTDDGHKNSWRLDPSDWGASAPPVKTESIQPESSNNNELVATTDSQQIEQIIRQTIHQELTPIKRQLLENQQQGPGAKDIAAGLGYIFGLAGLIAVFTSKKRKKYEE